MPSDILAESLLTYRSLLGDSNGARRSQAKKNQNLKSQLIFANLYQWILLILGPLEGAEERVMCEELSAKAV